MSEPKQAVTSLFGLQQEPGDRVIIDPNGDVLLAISGRIKRIQVSSNILASYSPVFKAMLTGRFREAMDLKQSQGKLYTLNLEDDDYDGMLKLCEVLYHRAEPPLSSRYQNFAATREEAEVVRKDLLAIRKVAVLADKYQISACTHFLLNWLSAFVRATDQSHFIKAIESEHTPIRLGICELSCLVKDEYSFQKATELLLLHSCRKDGLDKFIEATGAFHEHLPDRFFEIVAEQSKYLRESLQQELGSLKDFLLLGTPQGGVHDIKDTVSHGYYMNRADYAHKAYSSITASDRREIQSLYRVGTHDLMLMGGLIGALNRAASGKPDFNRVLSVELDSYKKLKVHEFATIRSLEPKGHWKSCRACNFDVVGALKSIVDKFKVEPLCLKCCTRGVMDCAWHTEDT